MFNKFRYNLGKFARRFELQNQSAPDLRVRTMQNTIGRVGGINFKIEKSPSGEWVAESTNVDGIITGGKNYPHDVNANIKDAVFTYFEIPPELCNDASLLQKGDVAEVEERVYV